MNINGLKLPAELEADLLAGGRKFSDDELSRFRELLNRVESPLPKLFDHDSIARENQLWNSESAQHYLGVPSDSVVPGDVDPKRTLIIGQAEPDSPLALDYRTEVPRVIYFGDIDYESYWIEVSPDYKSLVQMLQKETI